jgi:hypothetical protein
MGSKSKFACHDDRPNIQKIPFKFASLGKWHNCQSDIEQIMLHGSTAEKSMIIVQNAPMSILEEDTNFI